MNMQMSVTEINQPTNAPLESKPSVRSRCQLIKFKSSKNFQRKFIPKEKLFKAPAIQQQEHPPVPSFFLFFIYFNSQVVMDTACELNNFRKAGTMVWTSSWQPMEVNNWTWFVSHPRIEVRNGGGTLDWAWLREYFISALPNASPGSGRRGTPGSYHLSGGTFPASNQNLSNARRLFVAFWTLLCAAMRSLCVHKSIPLRFYCSTSHRRVKWNFQLDYFAGDNWKLFRLKNAILHSIEKQPHTLLTYIWSVNNYSNYSWIKLLWRLEVSFAKLLKGCRLFFRIACEHLRRSFEKRKNIWQRISCRGRHDLGDSSEFSIKWT